MSDIKFEFGDMVINEYASKDNPRRKGIFIRKLSKGFQFTDGKGNFWITPKDNDKLTIIGSVIEWR